MTLLFAFPLSAVAQALDAKPVLASLIARQKAVQNQVFRSVWLDFEKGEPAGWEIQEVYRDDLGRERLKRHFKHSGAHDLDTKTALFRDAVYDGELTADITFDPKKPAPAGSENSKGSWSAIVNPGKYPAGEGQSRHRTPFTFGQDSVIRQLQELNPQDIGMFEVDGKDLIELRFAWRGEENRVVLDQGNGPVITRFEWTDSQGGRHLGIIDYDHESDGPWLPASGSIRAWDPHIDINATPSREVRFKATYGKINDPNFDDSIFELELPPLTYVVDSRHAIAYRTETEKQYARDLAQLAVKAKEFPKSVAVVSEFPLQQGSGGFAIAFATVMVSLLLAGMVLATLFWLRRSRPGT